MLRGSYEEPAPATSAVEATRRQRKPAYQLDYMRDYRSRRREASKKVLPKEKASKKDQQQLAQKNGIQRTLDVSPLGPAPEEAATKFMTKGTEHEMQ